MVIKNMPKSGRIGLFYVVEKNIERIGFTSLYEQICILLRILPSERDSVLQLDDVQLFNIVEQIFLTCDWWRLFDICELMYRNLGSSQQYYSDKFTKDLNIVLIDEQLGFEMREGKIEKIGSALADEEIRKTRYLLKQPEFKGADEQFEKAIKALNARPKPDVENCVKDAVSAIESVGRILIKDDKAVLSDIIKDMAKQEIIPKPLDEVIQKIYAYRGNEPGVAHGLVGESKVTIYEAEYVLAMSAATIIYLVNKNKSNH